MKQQMGEVHVTVDLWNSADPARRTQVTALVDTGAMVNCLPEPVVRELHLEMIGTMSVQYADGRVERRSVYGPITLQLNEGIMVTDAVATPAGTDVLLSVVTLERLDLLVDPVEQRVKPRHPQYPGGLLGVRGVFEDDRRPHKTLGLSAEVLMRPSRARKAA